MIPMMRKETTMILSFLKDFNKIIKRLKKLKECFMMKIQLKSKKKIDRIYLSLKH